MIRNYQKQYYKKQNEYQVKSPHYLSGLFTHHYADEFYLTYTCPLCGVNVNVMKKTDSMISDHKVKIEYDRHVAGEMLNDLRVGLAEHYKSECGTDLQRRRTMAGMLIDKAEDRIYS